MPPITPYYFCPPTMPATTADGPSSSGCIEMPDSDTYKYFETKASYADLMKTLSEKFINFLSDDAIYETAIISWLVGREAGYSTARDEGIKRIFTDNFQSILDAPRVKFWRAKIGLILVNDIDNPHSREFLSLMFTGTNRPVFGINLPAGQTKFSNAEKMELLKALYVNLILPSGDELLEAECLTAQFELRAADSNLRSIAPSQSFEYLNAKVENVRGMRERVRASIANRISDQGWNPDTSLPYWSGTKMRDREEYRYRADAAKLEARIILFSTNYNDPRLEEKMTEAVKALNYAESIVDRYIESSDKVMDALKNLYRRFNISGTPYYNKSYADLLNISSIEEMKANAYYKMALSLQLSDTAKSLEYFAIAETLARTTINTMEGIKTDYDSRIQKYPTKPWLRNALFWRASILGSAKLLLAGISLAQDKNLPEAEQLIADCVNNPDRLVRGEEVVRTRLSLAEAQLRLKQSTYAGQVEKVRRAEITLVSLLDPNYTPAADADGRRARSLLTADPRSLGFPPHQVGGIVLIQAKILLAKYYLDDSQLDLPKEMAQILDREIRFARPDQRFAPTRADLRPLQRPNNGIFEDYELSSALQLRGDALYALDAIDAAVKDYEAALSVYKNKDGASLNYFAELSLADMANWAGNFREAKDLYARFQAHYQKAIAAVPSFKNARLQAELGLAETILRERTLEPGVDTTPESDRVVRTAKEALARSDEPYLIGRALGSIIEAVIAKKEQPEKKDIDRANALLEFRDKLFVTDYTLAPYLAAPAVLRKVGFSDKDQADLILKLADGLLFVHRYAEAEAMLKDFEVKYGPLFGKWPVIKAHYLLTKTEIAQRQGQTDRPLEIIAQLNESANILFSLKGQKRDPYLTARAIKSLVDAYINEDEFEAALALLYKARGIDPKTVYANLNLDGKLKKNTFAAMAESAQALFQGQGLKTIFVDKKLEAKWTLLDIELQIKTAEVLTWTKNYTLAKNMVEELNKNPGKLKELQKAKLLAILGNIASQSPKDRDYKLAQDYYVRAEAILKKLIDSQETILVKTEVAINHANILNYGLGIKNLVEAEKFYWEAKRLADMIEGNKKLQSASLASIYYGLAKLEEQKGNRVAALKYINLADQNKKALSKEQRQQVMLAKTRLADPTVALTHQTYVGSQVEHQEAVEAAVPLPDYLKKGGKVALATTLRMRFQADTTDGRNINSLYVGGGAQLYIDKAGTIGADCSGKVYSSGQGVKPIQYFRRPDIICGLSYWSRYATAELSGTFDLDAPKLNIAPGSHLSTAHANAMFNFSWLDRPVLSGLRFGPEYNQFNFVYNGEPRERITLAWTTRFELDLGVIPDFYYDLMRFRLAINWPMVEFIPGSEYFNNTETSGYQAAFSAARARAGAGLDLNLAAWHIPAILNLEVSYTNQFGYNNRWLGEQDNSFWLFMVSLSSNNPEVRRVINNLWDRITRSKSK